MSKVITPRDKDYSKWYNDIVINADLADHSAVRGCMVIKPHGYAIWENIQKQLDTMFKETGHVNAYFPLFVPKSFLELEEGHAEGFAKECAVVTHHRLMADPNNKGKLIVDPNSKLQEELIVRPTSEAIIWNTYKGWIQSYRDLPLLINQWANVVRWEMRTRLFLRTAEFLWQEGHTAHATKAEAIEETEKMLGVYADFVENYMALPVIKGIKTPSERFAGADETYCIEAMMQDGKALQAGTSHFLGQNFAKAFDVKFADQTGKLDFVWATSWGVSTRLMGALIMAHSDDQGLVIPPKLAPTQVVVVPIYKGEEELKNIADKVSVIKKDLESRGIRVKFDDSDKNKPGWKFAEHELKGTPIRLALGPRDLQNGTIELARRDTKTKESVSQEGLTQKVVDILDQMQKDLFTKAVEFRKAHTFSTNTYEEFKKLMDDDAGFVMAHWDGTEETEEKIKNETKATIRCMPLDSTIENGVCMVSGKPSTRRVLFAKAY
jgi:prolyl-tRNA synthetase